MEGTVLRYAPDYWDKNCHLLRKEYVLTEGTEEYKQLQFEVRKATQNDNLNILAIKRNQNIHDYGQLLLREQLLAVSNSHQSYYRVRRYVTIQKTFLNSALDYNIDPRRCGLSSLIFKKQLNACVGEVILVVQVVTDNYNEDFIEPKNSSEYFIDYIIEI